MRNFQAFPRILSFIVVLGCAVLLTGCPSGSGTESGTTVVDVPGGVTDPLTQPEQTICNPLNSPTGSGANNGIIANMVWLDATMPPRNGDPALPSVSDYFNIGNVVPSTLYFDRLYIPTRPFDLGFVTQDGQTILNDQGQPMYEYFALHLQSQLQLGETDPEGDYQMLMLADDGAVLKVADGADPSVYRTLVDDDGTHATKMACSNHTTSTVLHMTHDKKIPMMVDYYQGPRYHIALVVMWRPVPDGTDPDVPIDDPLCGVSGNDAFFDSTQSPPAPQMNFSSLEARGWKVLQNNNYAFPAQASNPCTTPVNTLTTSAVTTSDTTRTSTVVKWTTSIPSTSQVQYRNVSTGAIYTTTLDSTLVTDHSVSISQNLVTNVIFGFTALSTSPDGQSVQSDEFSMKMPR